jgi:hypothetical protein
MSVAKSFYDYLYELPRELLIEMLCLQQPKLWITAEGKSDLFPSLQEFKVTVEYPDGGSYQQVITADQNKLRQLHQVMSTRVEQGKRAIFISSLSSFIYPSQLSSRLLEELERIIIDWEQHPGKYS